MQASHGTPMPRPQAAAALWRAVESADPPVAFRDAALLAQVAASGLDGDESALNVRQRIALRLLERGRADIAAEVVRVDLDGRPVFSSLREGRAFLWLPGFDDPRADVPNDVYDISDRVLLRRAVDEVWLQDGRVVVGGYAHLSHLSAEPDDELTVVATSGEESVRVAALRCRRADKVADRGADLTRLAWSGFSAAIDAELLLAGSSAWTLTMELTRDGLSRTGYVPPSSAGQLLLPYHLQPSGHTRPSGHRGAGSSGSKGLRVTVGGRGRLRLTPSPPLAAAARPASNLLRRLSTALPFVPPSTTGR